MKIYLIFSLFLSFLIPFFSLAQKKQGQALIDSLLSELPKLKEDTNKVNLLNKLSFAYYSTRSGDGLKTGNQALELAEKLPWKKGILTATNNLGLNYFQQGDYDKALAFFQSSLKLSEELGLTASIANNYTYIGMIYARQTKYTKALEYYTKALKMNEAIGDKKGMASTYGSMGNVYYNQADFPKSLDYYLKALKLFEELKINQGISNCYTSIARVYSSQSNYVKAIEYNEKSLKLDEELGDKYGIAIDLNNIATIYQNQLEYPKALAYFTKALAFNEEAGNKYGMQINLNNLGNVHLLMKNYSKSLEYLPKSLTISHTIGDKKGEGINYGKLGNTYLTIVQDSNTRALNELFGGNKTACLQLAKVYTDSAILVQQEIGDLIYLHANQLQLSEIQSLLGDDKSALASYKNYTAVKDSIFNMEKDKKLTQTALNYEFAKREDSLKLVNEKRELGLQKEIEMKALSYEYEKKRQAAKTEEERQKLIYEEKLKQQEIENSYVKKIAEAEMIQKQKELESQRKELERQQKETIAKAEQEKKEIRQRNIRNAILAGLIGALIFVVSLYRQRNKIAKEKQRSEELLLNILPSETAEELKATGAAQAKNFAEVTVLFTDFKNFTALSERLTAQELVNEINYYYSAFDNIISKYDIEKIKTIGDSYMCAGGLPTANKTNAADTVKAALEIRDFMLKEKQKRQAQNKVFFEIRIGCNTGPVIAGIVGIKKFAYDIWGDTVNIAARMESSGEVGKVNISGSTYELVKDKFSCIHRGKIEAKNKGEIDMYYVEAKQMPMPMAT